MQGHVILKDTIIAGAPDSDTTKMSIIMKEMNFKMLKYFGGWRIRMGFSSFIYSEYSLASSHWN
jgi:hypothetical protein